jgi:alkanesulfonate monooxygenase SsuD/methylene tetrahydromethanopterin reductase-like flavin-dependent oxidoreductase (luciferase family)
MIQFEHQEDPGGTMKYGLFMMPSHPPERNIYDAHQWDLDYLALCDSLGYDEAWIGEHFTSPWEPIPAPTS